MFEWFISLFWTLVTLFLLGFWLWVAYKVYVWVARFFKRKDVPRQPPRKEKVFK